MSLRNYITDAILQKWLTSGAPTCTYQHLIECLRLSDLGAIAEQIIAALINNYITFHMTRLLIIFIMYTKHVHVLH